MKEFKVFEEIAANPSKKEKERLLKVNDSPTLRRLLYLTYNPFMTYRVNQLDIPTTFNTVQPDINEELDLLLTLLARHTTTPTEARGMLKRLMAKCTESGAKWVVRIIDRDLKIGISENTINKAFPELIPVFEVMLAFPMTEPKSGEDRWETVKYPAIAETKEDGMRIIAVCDGKSVSFRSRDGLEYDSLDYLADEILRFRPGTDFVLDGEMVGSVYNPNCATAKKNKEKGKNWVFAQGLSMTRSSKGSYSEAEMRSCLAYRVWDIVDYDYFLSQGKLGTCKPLKYRKTELAGLFERAEGTLKGIELLPNRVVHSKEEVVEFFKSVVSGGGEGVMLKDIDAMYEFRRSPYMLKLKEFYTADLRITGAIEGKRGTKYEGMLGALVVGDDAELDCEVGSGFDDDQRVDLWFRYKRGELVGGIVEVMFQERTADNSLRIPVFIRERPEKTTISWG